MLIVRRDLYTSEQAERLAASYRRLGLEFCSNSERSLSSPGIYEPEEVEEALELAKGKLLRWITTPRAYAHHILRTGGPYGLE